jgi:hypothetical protein
VSFGAFLFPDETMDNLEHLTPEIIRELDSLIGRSIADGAGFVQVWAYIQVEGGIVRQLGVSPVVGQSVRLPDGGRRPYRGQSGGC